MTYESNHISERNAELRAMLIEALHYRSQGRVSLAAIVEAEAVAYRAKTLDLVKAFGTQGVFA